MHVLVLAVLAVSLLATRPDVVLPRLKAVLQGAGYVLQVDDMELSLTPLRISVQGLDLSSRTPGGPLVRLPHFTGSFSVMRGLSGGAWIRELHLERPNVRLVLKPGTGRTGSPPDTGRLLTLLDMDKAVVSNGTVTLVRGEMSLTLQDLNATLLPYTGEMDLAVSARFEALGPEHNATAAGTFSVDLQGTPTAASVKVKEGQLDFNHSHARGGAAVTADLSLAQSGLSLNTLSANATLERLAPVQGEGWRDLPVRIRYTAPSLAIRAGKMVEVNGTLSSKLTAGPVIRLSGFVQPEHVLEGSRQILPALLRDVKLTGVLPVDVSYDPAAGYQATVRPEALRVHASEVGASAEISGRIELAGRLDVEPSIEANIKARKAGLRYSAFEAANATLALQAAGSPNDLQVTQLTASVPAESYRLPVVGNGLGRIELDGRLQVKELRRVDLAQCNLVMDRVGRLQATGSIDGKTVRAELASEPLNLSGLIGLAPEGMLAGWSTEGSVSMKASVQGDLPRPAVEGRMELSDLSLSSADGSILAMIGRSTLSVDRPEKERYRARLTLDTGECLVDTIYLNFSDQPLKAEIMARPGDDFKTIDKGVIDLSLGRLFRAQGENITLFRDGSLDYSGRFAVISDNLGQVFTTFVQEPFAASHPGLNEMSLAGRIRLNADVQGKDKRSQVNGVLAVSELNATSGESIAVNGLGLELPLSYIFGLENKEFLPPERPSSWGRLNIDRAVTPLGELKAIDLGVSMVPNRLFVDGHLDLPVFGGTLTVRDVRVERPLSSQLQVALQAALSRVDMQDVPAGTFRFNGHLAGDLGLVTINRERVSVSGGLSGSFYGGELTVENIMARQPFSPSRVAGADVSVQGMDLKGFTTTLGAGLIFGRMDVDLERFRLAYGQPVAFELKAVSVEAEGVDQEVSLRAVDSISVLGTGQGITSTAINIFRTFVQQFDYETIGIACTLENDVFKVSGLVHENGVEYLVKKPPLFGINVINRNPNNRISFKDMMGRVERVLKKDNKPSDQDETVKEAS